MKKWLIIVVIVSRSQISQADALVIAPTPGSIGGPTDVSTINPFLIKQVGLTSMRYQQVYSAAVFSKVPLECKYLTSLTFFLDAQPASIHQWRINNMQMNLSTTQKSANNLSTNFTDNVGPDDMIVFGPAQHDFDGVGPHGRLRIIFPKPFPYNPASGNLLLDVRIFDGGGPIDVNSPALNAWNSSTDEASIVWATNVMASVACAAETAGLDTVIQMSGVPSLQIQVESVFGTNRPVIRWPAQPTVFALQTSSRVGTNAVWQTITNGIGGSPEGPDRWIYLPVQPPGTSGLYQLVWELGQPVQPAAVPFMPGRTSELLEVK